MGWFNDGDWAGLRIDQWNIPLFQMCWAVNEREDQIGLTLTDWRTYNGLKNKDSSSFTSDDFIGMRIAGSDVLWDVQKLRERIEDLIDTGLFINLSTKEPYTELSEILPNGWTTDMRPANYDVWSEIKTCLDALKYFSVPDVVYDMSTLQFLNDWDGTVQSYLQSSNDESSAHNAYYEAIHNPDYTSDWSSIFISLACSPCHNTGYYDATYIPYVYIHDLQYTPEPNLSIINSDIKLYVVLGTYISFEFTITGSSEIYNTASYNEPTVLTINTSGVTSTYNLGINDLSYSDNEDIVAVLFGYVKDPINKPYEYTLMENVIAVLQTTYG